MNYICDEGHTALHDDGKCHTAIRGTECGLPLREITCLNEGPDCEGPVEFHLRPSDWKSFPRCEFHQAQREEQRENSMEKYADSDIAPDWFDPSYAGERWEDD